MRAEGEIYFLLSSLDRKLVGEVPLPGSPRRPRIYLDDLLEPLEKQA